MPSQSDLPIAFVVDAKGLTRSPSKTDAPLWWGIIGLILIELSVVSAFTVSYFYLQMTNPTWPPPEMPAPELFIPSLSLAILLTSCITMYLAGRTINKNYVWRFVLCTFTSVGLAVVVLVIRWQQFRELDFSWDDHVYGSLVWTISGFHFIHVVSAAIGTAVIGLLGILGYFNSQRNVGVVVDTLYWNFVAFAWIPFYFVLYWVPRLS